MRFPRSPNGPGKIGPAKAKPKPFGRRPELARDAFGRGAKRRFGRRARARLTHRLDQPLIQPIALFERASVDASAEVRLVGGDSL